MNSLRMSAHRWWILAVLFGLVASLTLVVPNVSADSHTEMFDISVYHGINGRSLGLDKELPVDVYVNGQLAIPGLEFKDKIETQLPGGEEYTFIVKLAGTDTTVMSLEAGTIPAGADVSVHAKLSAGKTPELKAMVK